MNIQKRVTTLLTRDLHAAMRHNQAALNKAERIEKRAEKRLAREQARLDNLNARQLLKAA